jgi:hypothetical protein
LASALAFVYFEDEPGRRAAANLMAKDEARRIATDIAKLPELVAQMKNPGCMNDRAKFSPKDW